MNPGKLFIVGTSIGNSADISKRAIDTLTEADLIIGEEYKHASKLLKSLGIEKEIVLLNEHSKEDDVEDIISLLHQGKTMAMISDSGMPLIADPGDALVERIHGIVPIEVIPGPTALITALAASGLPAIPFTFHGFLPANKDERRKKLHEWKKIPHTQIIYETPYRYKKVIADMKKVFGPGREVFLALDLTLPSEIVFAGNLGTLAARVEQLPKAMPVIVF